MARSEITQEYIKSFLYYNKIDGNFYYTKYRNRSARVGDIAGRIHRKGYRRIMINRKSYSAHRLVFLYLNGSFPDGEIDHINCKKSDNRYENLRVCSRKENIRNSPSYRGKLMKGVSLNKKTGKFVARITVDYKRILLGTFGTEKEAGDAYVKACKNFHGKFSNTTKYFY